MAAAPPLGSANDCSDAGPEKIASTVVMWHTLHHLCIVLVPAIYIYAMHLFDQELQEPPTVVD